MGGGGRRSLGDLVLFHLGTKGGCQCQPVVFNFPCAWLPEHRGVSGLHGSLLTSVLSTWHVTEGRTLCLPPRLMAGRLVPASRWVARPHTCPSLESVRTGASAVLGASGLRGCCKRPRGPARVWRASLVRQGRRFRPGTRHHLVELSVRQVICILLCPRVRGLACGSEGALGPFGPAQEGVPAAELAELAELASLVGGCSGGDSEALPGSVEAAVPAQGAVLSCQLLFHGPGLRWVCRDEGDTRAAGTGGASRKPQAKAVSGGR